MRTINEIKQDIAQVWMDAPAVQEAYGFNEGTTFDNFFRAASIENLIFYVVAVAIWTVEHLIYDTQTSLTQTVEAMVPHRPKWYCLKCLDFMKDHILIPDTDTYDTSNLTEAEISAAKVVKYAVATESDDASLLTIKVATGSDNARQPLDPQTQTQLSAYLQEIKDAGVRILLINQEPDLFKCHVDIFYDPQRTPEDVEADVRTAIRNYLNNISFGGEYTNMALIDAIQAVPGVKIAELRTALARPTQQDEYQLINARYTPNAGYLTPGPDEGNVNLLLKPY